MGEVVRGSGGGGGGGGGGIKKKKKKERAVLPPAKLAWENEVKRIPFHVKGGWELKSRQGPATGAGGIEVAGILGECEKDLDLEFVDFCWLPNRVPYGGSRGREWGGAETAPHLFQPLIRKRRKLEKIDEELEICVDVDQIPDVEGEKRREEEGKSKTGGKGGIDHFIVVEESAHPPVLKEEKGADVEQRDEEQVGTGYGWRWQLLKNKKGRGQEEDKLKKSEKKSLQTIWGKWKKTDEKAGAGAGGRPPQQQPVMGHQYEMTVLGASSDETKKRDWRALDKIV